MGGPNYGNRTGHDRFRPEADEGNDVDTAPGRDIDYGDLEDKWYEIENGYKDRYPALTDRDVMIEPAHFERTIERIEIGRGEHRTRSAKKSRTGHSGRIS